MSLYICIYLSFRWDTLWGKPLYTERITNLGEQVVSYRESILLASTAVQQWHWQHGRGWEGDTADAVVLSTPLLVVGPWTCALLRVVGWKMEIPSPPSSLPVKHEQRPGGDIGERRTRPLRHLFNIFLFPSQGWYCKLKYESKRPYVLPRRFLHTIPHKQTTGQNILV